MKTNRLLQFLLMLSVGCLYNQGLYAQIEWVEIGNNPVLDLGSVGSWDEGVVFEPHVIQVGDTTKMWYSGSAQSQGLGLFEIGYAWSVDGVNWNRFTGNPVLPKRPGEWDNVGTGMGAVIQDGDTLRMWYNGFSTGDLNQPGNKIGYATSLDGINWTRHSAPVLQAGSGGEWDDEIISPGSVVKEGDTFKMWYSGGRGSFPSTITLMTGLATSTDGVNWTKYKSPTSTQPPFQFSAPVLRLGSSGAWDTGRTWTRNVRRTPNGYEMWYAGSEGGLNAQAIGYATSSDGIAWTKSSDNPVLVVSPTWAIECTTPAVILEGETYRMWLTGFRPGSPFPGRIGYATAPMITSVGEEVTSVIPSEFALHQNFPNPFNPETEIRFQLPTASHVVLKIFNNLGQEIRILADGRYEAGFQSISWDGKDNNGQPVASGIYLYQLKTGVFFQIKKMSLIR